MTNLYAWTTTNTSVNVTTIYTLSETPSAGDSIYKADGTAYSTNDEIFTSSYTTSQPGVSSYSNGAITLDLTEAHSSSGGKK